MVILVLLTGCSKSTTEKQSPKTEQTEQQELSVEKELFDVKLNLQASLFEGQDLEQVKKDALDEGVHEVNINGDGSLTYIMSKSQYRKMMNEIAKSIDDYTKEFLSNDENKSIFKDIAFSNDYTELNVKVDASQYNEMSDFSLIGLNFHGLMYQAFDGVDSSKLALKTNIINYSSGEIIKTSVYPNEQ